MSNQTNNLLSLQSHKPLAYLLPNTHLQDHLSYVDQETSSLNSKISYIIKLQKQSMTNINLYTYIQQIQLPNTPFLNSTKFISQLQRVKRRLQQNNQSNKKQNKSKAKLAQIDKQKLVKNKLSLQALRSSNTKINQSLISYEENILKNITLQQSKLLSPLVLKQMIQSLEVQKSILRAKIEREKQQIDQINRLRKYQQLQAKQKQQIIQQRIKLMVNKRRKLQ